MPDDLRQCDACGNRVKGNLTPAPHDCGHGASCKPRNHTDACEFCTALRAHQDTLRMARVFGIELAKNS